MQRKDILENLIYADSEKISAYVSGIVDQLEITNLESPEGGLFQLKMKDSVCHTPFYLGEISVAKACVRIFIKETNQTLEGGAVVMKDDASYAYCLAICDALVSETTPFSEAIVRFAEEGKAVREKKVQERNHILNATKVDFSLLEE